MSATASAERVIRVLIVEDREDDFHFLAHVFRRTRRLAFSLTWARNYQEGIAALRAGGHDVAFFDYSLGTETGIDLLRAAQAMGATLPILLLTGRDDDETDEAALAAGAVDFLGKATLDHVHLERAVRYALRQSDTRSRLRQSRQQLELFLQSLPLIAGRLDDHGRVTEARGSGLEHAGILPDALLGTDFIEMFPQSAEAVREALAGGSAHFSVSGALGATAEWHGDFVVTFDAVDASGAVFVGRDVTSRRWLERRLLSVTDAEQQRIGADLHDGLGQQLTGLSCLAAAMRDRLVKKAPDEKEQADLIARLANEAVGQSRALARGLCPVQLENAGLVVALEEMAGQAKLLHGVDCQFSEHGTAPNCDRLAAIHLYRIAQEAVHNAVRHGKAGSIHISLTTEGNQHRLVVVDDGAGFDPAACGQAPGGGLRLMGYRAVMIGGVFAIDSAPGRGTSVTCEFTTLPSTHENERIGKKHHPEDCEVAC